MPKRMVVIGGGLGGLSLALRAASRGWHVTLCERASQVGGKMNRLLVDGYCFDTGPSLITLPYLFTELLEECKVDYRQWFRFRRLNPLTQYSYSDGVNLFYPAPLPQLAQTVEALEPNHGNGFWRLLTIGGKLYQLSLGTFFHLPPTDIPRIGELLRVMSSLRHFPLRHAWGNYAAVVERFITSEYLRRVFLRYPTYVGSSPYRAPAALLLIPYIEFASGGWYVEGGLYRIVESIVHGLKQYETRILTDTPVVRILIRAGRVRGIVTATGDVIDADCVVYNGDATTIHTLLGTVPRRAIERSMSGVIFLVGLRTRLTCVHHHTIAFSRDYRLEFAELIDHRRFPTEPTVYLNVASMTDRTLAPQNGETLFIMANAPANDGQRWTNRMAEQAWERICTTLHRCGINIPDSQIALRYSLTPQYFEDVYAMPGGSIYGPASHSYSSTFLRPSMRDRHVRGLYYVGGSTHPGGGTPMVVLSSKIVYNLIERYEGCP